MTITIYTYTATWDRAMRPTAPRVGTHVESPEDCAAQEWDGFCACLRANGLALDHVRGDTYRVVRRDTEPGESITGD